MVQMSDTSLWLMTPPVTFDVESVNGPDMRNRTSPDGSFNYSSLHMYPVNSAHPAAYVKYNLPIRLSPIGAELEKE